ncbi:hypothetical protein [Rummeliibacillus pycnus]|uniref:hypothetical protein n=1 Tax=Rummeliibacillus pycnus TaxID=101070 RepID=UPI0037C9E905
MKYTYYLLSLIPVAFLFHFYEYGQHVKGEEAKYLFLTWIFYILITGILSVHTKKRNVIVSQIASCVISIILAKLWIKEDYWFAPFGRDIAVVWIAGITCIGQLIIRAFVNFSKKGNP